MIQTLLKELQSLVNEHGSAAILRERIAVIQDRIAALERENADLRAQCEQAKAKADECQSRLDRFAKDNPHGHRCGHCGGLDLVRSGSKRGGIFSALGVDSAVFTCRLCGGQSDFLEDAFR